jgi:hypothetical protein
MGVTVTEQDIQKIKQIIEPIYGEKAWGAHRLFGISFHCHFGKPTRGSDWGSEVSLHGQWWLCVKWCGWRLQADNELIAASNDPHEMDAMIECLNGKFITSIDIERPSLLTTITFNEGLLLRLFPTRAEREYDDEDFWKLFTPDKHVLTIGPGTQWHYGRSDVPVSRKKRERKQED